MVTNKQVTTKGNRMNYPVRNKFHEKERRKIRLRLDAKKNPRVLYMIAWETKDNKITHERGCWYLREDAVAWALDKWRLYHELKGYRGWEVETWKKENTAAATTTNK